jgi:hypothetical protein
VNGTARRGGLLAAVAILVAPCTGHAQEWRATARFGRIAYEGAPAGSAADASVVLGIGRTAPRDWLGVSAAVPVGGQPFWAVAGGWKRFATRSAAGVLLDLSAHGFVQREAAAGPAGGPGIPLPPGPGDDAARSGGGGGGELMGGGFAAAGVWRFEARGGAVAQRSEVGGVLQERVLATGDARISALVAPFIVQAETRGWQDEEATHVYGGGVLHLAQGPLQLWGGIGRWLEAGISGVTWSAGVTTTLRDGVELQVGGRGNTFDPLYLSTLKTSVWGGLTLRLGGGRTGRAPVPARYAGGRALIRVPARDAAGAVSIAGDFTGWKPAAMRREGSHWTYDVPLAPGVYHYAFVREDGTWFVPETVPGRQRDGMGGWVAVLVVS